MSETRPNVAIVDYGMGNLFSVKRACENVGLDAIITSSCEDIESADAVILPGVGAFGDAMDTLERLELVSLLQETARSGKPLLGICLGVQLLMTESFEFGRHKGLGLFKGPVVRFDGPAEGSRKLKVPQVGWNRIIKARNNAENQDDPWAGTLLDGVCDEEFIYFVHSYIVQPEDKNVVLSTTRYGQIEFCSSLGQGNIFACQFHPERSGAQGLKVYQNLASLIRNTKRRN
jgi:imidazole glycerol-phosphate synthase subunit HisH